MIGRSTNKTLVFILIATLFALFIFAPVAEAKGATNSAPVITTPEPCSITVNQDTTGTVNLTAKDANGDTMTWSVLSPPSQGTAKTINPTNRRGTSTVVASYTPSSGQSGSDSFVVKVQDSKGATDAIAINVTIIPNQPKATLSYVSLGDSIATGTIYSGKVITSYVTYFYQFLQTKNPTASVTLTKLASDGDRTNELYSKLGVGSIGDSAFIATVSAAKIITLSIGGNNLMQAAKDSTSLGGYNFNYINTTVADQGLQDFQNQWVPIIQKIKSLNPSAQLIVNTVYNPYNESDATLHNTVDSYLFRADGSGLNDLILNNAATMGYSVANVYASFNDNYSNNMGAVTYFYPTDFWGTLTRNPHPNTAGQNILTSLCEQVYKPIN